MVEGFHGGDGGGALETEGAGELEVQGGQLDCKEGLAASIGTAIADVLRLRDALDAEDLLTLPSTADQLGAELETDPAFEVLEGVAVLDVVFRVVGCGLH
jgi:hypothetical protein